MAGGPVVKRFPFKGSFFSDPSPKAQRQCQKAASVFEQLVLGEALSRSESLVLHFRPPAQFTFFFASRDF